jgi:hypothetical protein
MQEFFSTQNLGEPVKTAGLALVHLNKKSLFQLQRRQRIMSALYGSPTKAAINSIGYQESARDSRFTRSNTPLKPRNHPPSSYPKHYFPVATPSALPADRDHALINFENGVSHHVL